MTERGGDRWRQAIVQGSDRWRETVQRGDRWRQAIVQRGDRWRQAIVQGSDRWRQAIVRGSAPQPVNGIVARTLLALLIVILSVAVVRVIGIGDDDKGGGSATPNGGGGTLVTAADNNGEVTVHPNQPFVVSLKGSPDAPWGVPHAESGSLAVVKSSEEVDGSASATFVPQEVAPAVVVRAERGGASDETFAVTIRVVG